MAEAVSDCVHCGFCLPTCPTYLELGQEMDSPRGRIYLMKQALEGEIAFADAALYVDRCLGCMACVSSCPSGVEYGELLSPFRDLQRRRVPRPTAARWRRRLALAVLPHPRRFRWAVRAGRLLRPLRPLLPAALSSMFELLPERLAPKDELPPLVPAQGERRARVALLTGCVQQTLAPEIHRATLDVLSRNGVETVIPSGQGCCGALPWHLGEAPMTRQLGRRLIEVFPDDVDAIVTNTAGCGSAMREYGFIFRGEAEQEGAERLAERTLDVTVFLDRLGLIEPLPLPQPTRVAYHDACHLAHAQGVRHEPRRLLRSIANLTLLEIPQGEICCGSAGTYNLDQPEIAFELGQRKIETILTTEADVVAAANIGCLVQLRMHLGSGPEAPLALHPLEILARAYSAADAAAK